MKRETIPIINGIITFENIEKFNLESYIPPNVNILERTPNFNMTELTSALKSTFVIRLIATKVSGSA